MRGWWRDRPVAASAFALLAAAAVIAVVITGSMWWEAAAYARAATCATPADADDGDCLLDLPATVVDAEVSDERLRRDQVLVWKAKPGPVTYPTLRATLVAPDPMFGWAGAGTPVTVRVWRGTATRITWWTHVSETADSPAHRAVAPTAGTLFLLAGAGLALAVARRRDTAIRACAAVLLGSAALARLIDVFGGRFRQPPVALAAFLVATVAAGLLVSRRGAAAGRPTPRAARAAAR